MNRPFVWVAAGLTLGLLAAGEEWPGSLGIFPALAAGAAALFLIGRFPHMDRIAVLLAFFGGGLLLWHVRHADRSADALGRFAIEAPRTRLTVEGVVRENDALVPGSDYIRLILDVNRTIIGQDPRPLNGGVIVRLYSPSGPIYAGERVRVTGELMPELGPVNHGVYDIEDYFRVRGVHSELRASGADVAHIRIEPASLMYWLARLRQQQAELFAHAVPRDILPFVLAVWLGERGQLAEQERDSYTLSGTAHILSVSGVHMGIVYLSASFLLRIFLRRGRLRVVLGMGVVLLFALLTGARVATLRSAVMILVYIAADLFEREPDAPTALSLSGILLLCANPDNLYDAGFLLSFASVSSLLLFAPLTDEWLARVPRFLRRPLAPALGVQILPFPLAAHFFHVLPLGAPLANLLVVPLLTLVLWLCAAVSLLGGVLPGAGLLFGHALYPCVFLIRQTAALVSEVHWLHGTVTSPTASAVMLYTMGALMPFIGRTMLRPRLRAAAAVLLCSAAALFWAPWGIEPGVDFLDVGHADAAVVRTPDGTTFLIDGGDRSRYGDAGSRVVLPYLYANHITRLDFAAVSHPDRDHAGGLVRVLEQMPVDTLLLGPEPSDRKLEQELLDVCQRRGVAVRRLRRGDTLSFHDARVDVLHPPPGRDTGGHMNDNSLTLRFSWPGLRVLFPGDVEAAGEQLIARSDCAATVLKSPHHGSMTSSTGLFLKAVAPAHVVISTRTTGSLEAVAPAVSKRYREMGATVWRTDLHGGVRLRLCGDGLVFTGARVARGYRAGPEMLVDQTERPAERQQDH